MEILSINDTSSSHEQKNTSKITVLTWNQQQYREEEKYPLHFENIKPRSPLSTKLSADLVELRNASKVDLKWSPKCVYLHLYPINLSTLLPQLNASVLENSGGIPFITK